MTTSPKALRVSAKSAVAAKKISEVCQVDSMSLPRNREATATLLRRGDGAYFLEEEIRNCLPEDWAQKTPPERIAIANPKKRTRQLSFANAVQWFLKAFSDDATFTRSAMEAISGRGRASKG